MVNKYYETDCNLSLLDGKTVASSALALRATHTPKTWQTAA